LLQLDIAQPKSNVVTVIQKPFFGLFQPSNIPVWPSALIQCMLEKNLLTGLHEIMVDYVNVCST
jgi:hypothetical protein